MDNRNDKKGTVLIVDDDSAVLRFLSTIIEKDHYIVFSFTDPKQALQRFPNLHPDIVLSDIVMPEMSGFEFINEVNKIRPDVPVIFITGYPELERAIDAIRLGAFDFIVKPIKPELLLHSVQRAVSFSRLRQKEKEHARILEESIQLQTEGLQNALEEAQYKTMEMTGLFNAARSILAAKETPDFNEVLKSLGETVGADRAYIFKLRESETVIENTHEWREPRMQPMIDRLQRLDAALFPWWLEKLNHDEIIVITDVKDLHGEALSELDKLMTYDTKSILAVPLRFVPEGMLMGFMGIAAAESRAWTDEDMRMLTVISEMISSYVARRKAEDELLHNYEIGTVLNTLLQLSIENISLDEILTRALDLILSVPWLNFEPKGCIFLVDEQKNELIMTASRGFADVLLSSCARVAFGSCLCGTAALTGKMVFEEDLSEAHTVRYEGIAPHGHYCVPILFEERIMGVINIYLKAGYRKRSVDERFLFSVANTLAGVMERKKAEKSLTEAYAALKAAQSQILQQEKMSSIGQLAAGIAHEINNPIGYIMSNLGSLMKYNVRIVEYLRAQELALGGLLGGQVSDPVAVRTKLDELKGALKIDYILNDMESLIGESMGGAERVKKIVQDLKSFSHVDEAEFMQADINKGLESTINIVWNELKYKTALKKEYGDIPLTRCNLGQLNQVFLNLLMNAVQAIEKEGEINVKTWADGGFIHVAVSDTGCGIPPDKLNRIFEPFFTTKPVGKGTGLGLSIAYDIVKKHNGEIVVESEAGKGTTFIVKLPVVE